MDYSSIHENEDLQAGSSPWATSPQQNRHLDRTTSTDAPPSPAPANLGPSAADSSDLQQHERAPSPEDAVHATDNTPQSALPHRDQQRPIETNGQHRPNHPQFDREDGHQRHVQGGHQATRSHARPKPRYTMTAKINGMERAGRKDPMFRFDVHVSE